MLAGRGADRADLVIFWGCDPATTHPRHAERYSGLAAGKFTPNGRADRRVVMMGDADEVGSWRLDPSGSLPDLTVPIKQERSFEALISCVGWSSRAAHAPPRPDCGSSPR